jgi:selenocysteine lyase/cysteine desulfurase
MDPSMTGRIYLDHAATRFPKPAVVIDAMHAFSRDSEAAVGRGAYRASQAAGQIVARLRNELASWIDADEGQEISLHAGGTEALNAAIFGVLRPGDHVVTTAAEHNSVLRPLAHLADEGSITWTIVPVDATGTVAADRVLQAVQPRTRMVAVVHAANVNGAVQPVARIGKALADQFAEDQRPLLLCDAAQSFGHVPLSVNAAGIDLLAAPGHKGGWGPLGTGLLYARKRFHDAIRPTRFGGTGSQSESLRMPHDYPAALEAGNLNVPALAGWLAGLQSRRNGRSPTEALTESETQLRRLAVELYDHLEAISGVRVIGKPAERVLPVASIAIEGFPAGDAAMILDSEFGIEVRSGLHCAALIHQAIGSPPDGTLRISCGETTSSDDLRQLAAALAELAAG